MYLHFVRAVPLAGKLWFFTSSDPRNIIPDVVQALLDSKGSVSSGRNAKANVELLESQVFCLRDESGHNQYIRFAVYGYFWQSLALTQFRVCVSV